MKRESGGRKRLRIRSRKEEKKNEEQFIKWRERNEKKRIEDIKKEWIYERESDKKNKKCKNRLK